MACQGALLNPPGAFRDGEWIHGGTWDPEEKPEVEGQITWPGSAISVAVEGGTRVVRANNLPRHPTGEYPVRPGTRAYDYDRNPNSIGEQTILLRLPVAPDAQPQSTCVPMGMIGFMLTGAALFSAVDAGGRDAPAHEIQDHCHGHPEMSRQYHYHNWSDCLAGSDPDAPVGWMLDGFPILGPVDAKGHDFTNDELDECHGHIGDVVIDGRRVRQYHYRFTRTFPYSIGCFRGAVDPGLLRGSGRPPPPWRPAQ
jgi:hypothetical protein